MKAILLRVMFRSMPVFVCKFFCLARRPGCASHGSVCAVDDSRPRHHTRRKRTVLGQKVCAFAVLQTHNVWRKHQLKCACFKSRILQLWIRLPAAQRSVEPRVQLIRLKDTPIRHEPGVEARIYSGSSGGLLSPTKNYAPVTMVDFQLGPGAEVMIYCILVQKYKY